MTAEPLIQLEGITKTFGSGETAVTVLKGVSLAVQPGEMTGIIGASAPGGWPGHVVSPRSRSGQLHPC